MANIVYPVSDGAATRASLGLQTPGAKVLLIIGSSTAAGIGYEAPDKVIYSGSGPGGTEAFGAGWLSESLTSAGWSVVNIAIGGTDTAFWLSALPGNLAFHRPDAVLVACSSSASGDNVVASEANFSTYQGRHAELFRLIRQAGAVPICQAQLPNNTYTNAMLERMRRFQRWLESINVLSWDILSALGSESLDGKFWNVTAACGISIGSVNFTTASHQPQVGQYVTGTGIAANTRVATFTPGVGGTLSIAATATNAAATLSLTITPDGTHLSSRALAHRAAFRALPLDLILNGGRLPVLPEYGVSDKHSIRFTGTDNAPITIPLSDLDSFSVTFDLLNTDLFLAVNPLFFAGPNNVRMRLTNGSVSLRVESRAAEIQSPLLENNSNDGLWHRWTVTFNSVSKKWKLYEDGVQIIGAASGSSPLETDGSIVCQENPATAVTILSGSGANTYMRGTHGLRNIVIHACPLTAGAVQAMASGVMQADSLYAWYPCDDAVRNASSQLPLGGKLRNVAGTLVAANLSPTGAFVFDRDTQAVARNNLGLGSAHIPQFAGLQLGTGGIFKQGPAALSALGAAATAGAGSAAWITDSTLPYTGTNIGATAVGGSTNLAPVYSDGTNWKIG